MNADQYIRERLDQQIDWYDNSSLANQRSFKRLRTVEFILAAAIPFLVSFEELNMLVGLIGVVIAVITGAIGLNQYQENWTRYRASAEALKREKYRFQTQTFPYDTGQEQINLGNLVERVEAILCEENSEWINSNMPLPQREGDGEGEGEKETKAETEAEPKAESGK